VSNVPAFAGRPDPDSIQTAADFARGLQALRDQSGLRIREVARLTGGQRSTVGGYFSGQHLPLDRELLTRLLTVCGESDPATLVRGAGNADPIYTVVFAPDGTTIAAASVNTELRPVVAAHRRRRPRPGRA